MRLLACLIVAPQRGYDEPAILSYAISSFCPTSADGLQRRERAADPLHYPDVTLKALVRGGELKVDDLGDLTYSVDRVLVLGPSQSFCAGRELVAMFPRCSSLQPQPVAGLRNAVDHERPESRGMTLNCFSANCRLTRCYAFANCRSE